MGVTVTSIKKLVDGSRRVNQATLAFTTSVTDGDSLAPEKVGLHSVEGASVIGVAGTYNAQVNYIPASSKIQLIVNDTTAAATATVTCEFIGW